MKIYKVGGCVRDTLMGREPKDIDYVVVDATPDEMFSAGFRQVGADFPVFLHPDTKEEYALARIERKTGIGYSGFTSETNGVTLEMDLSRRDLTINSMAMDDAGNIVDPFHGQADIESRMLRHTSEAFREDPLRVIRVARFAARYPDFRIAEMTLTMMREMVRSGELNAIPNERFHAELDKVYGEVDAVRFFAVLMDVEAFQHVDFFRGVYGAMDRTVDRSNCQSVLEYTQHIPADMRKSAHIAMTGMPNILGTSTRGDYLLISRDIKKLWGNFRNFNVSLPHDELVDNLVSCGAFRQGDDFANLLACLDAVDGMRGTQSGTIARILSIELALITAKNFPDLSGKDIGAAIRTARIARVKRFFAEMAGE